MPTSLPRKRGVRVALFILSLVAPACVLAQVQTPVSTMRPDVVITPPPDPAMVNARRDDVVAAVAAARADNEEPVDLVARLLVAEYPPAWVVEEIVFLYGPFQLPELVAKFRFMVGQSSKDVLRDAVRLGAARRAAERVRMCRGLRAAGTGAVEVLGRPVAEAEAICAWETVEWNLVGLGEYSTDLRFLAPNDDPGGYVSAQ